MGGWIKFLNKRKTRLPPAPIPKAAREKGTVSLARSTANGTCATRTSDTKPDSGHQQHVCDLAQVPFCGVPLVISVGIRSEGHSSGICELVVTLGQSLTQA